MSSLDRVIRREISDDEFFDALLYQAAHAPVSTVLEIGASSGDGSTEALARGIARNPAHPVLHTIEVSEARFANLAARWRRRADVRPYNVSSVDAAGFADEAEVRRFRRTVRSGLDAWTEEVVLDWLAQDLAYLRDSGVPLDGIRRIKAENDIDDFGLVLIDGSEFTGRAELELVYGAAIIALDDIMTYKNWENHRRLLADPAYEIVAMNRYLRNGYSIFIRR